MLALKLLLTVAGAMLLATALAIPLYTLFQRMQTMRKKTNAPDTVARGATPSGRGRLEPGDSSAGVGFEPLNGGHKPLQHGSAHSNLAECTPTRRGLQ